MSLLESRNHPPPFLCRFSGNNKKSFHQWSKYEPVGQLLTDHWAKQKCRYYQHTQIPTGQYISFCDPDDDVVSYGKRKSKRTCTSALLRSNGTPSVYRNVITPVGTVAPVGDPKFNKLLRQELHNPGLVKRPPPRDSKGYATKVYTPSSYNERAKQGYVYWFQDRRDKKLNYELQRTIGSVGSNLGIGSAPRS